MIRCGDQCYDEDTSKVIAYIGGRFEFEIVQYRAIANQARTVRLPIHVLDAYKKIDRTTETMRQELGGLGALRTLVENAGGSMEVSASETFLVKIAIPGE